MAETPVMRKCQRCNTDYLAELPDDGSWPMDVFSALAPQKDGSLLAGRWNFCPDCLHKAAGAISEFVCEDIEEALQEWAKRKASQGPRQEGTWRPPRLFTDDDFEATSERR